MFDWQAAALFPEEEARMTADAFAPLERFSDLAKSAPPPDQNAAAIVRARDKNLCKPPGSLGRLEEIVEWLAAWQRRAPPRAERMAIAVFAGNHGVTQQGVSAYPSEVTAQMVANFRSGGAAINQIARSNGLELSVIPCQLDTPAGDITLTDAMSAEECANAMELGAQSTAETLDLLAIGEMGIGNTTSASAIFYALFGGSTAAWVGPGTGVAGGALERKVSAVEKAVVRFRKENRPTPLEVLRCLGGREIAAMAGAILAARHRRLPVLIDGFVATAAAAVVAHMADGGIDHCMIGHLSAEPAHVRVLERLGKRPLLNLDMRLGEGSGAGVAAAIVRLAVDVHRGMATFTEAGVSDTDAVNHPVDSKER